MSPQQPDSDIRPWGRWAVLHERAGMKIKLIEVEPGHRLSLQYHHYRSEFWICIAGIASAVVGDRNLELSQFETASIPVGTVHRLGNSHEQPLLIVEIQNGDRLVEDDIVRLEDDYNRADVDIHG
jgi:mannose-6-phosphate isomerase